MERISNLLDISTGSVVSVIGCGGKTSMIGLIAKQNAEKKVLITPTTKTFPVHSDDVILCVTLKSCMEHKPQKGIQCLGLYNERNSKLEALPEQVLTEIIPMYDIVLMEADGSRWLPCKGWLDNEPVIHFGSTHTVGVVTMDALGKPASNKLVHHLPEFLELTGIKEGDIITEQVLVDMVTLPKGMFKKTQGHNYLVVNKVEDKSQSNPAISFLEAIKTKAPGRFKRLIYGSVHKNTWQEV